MSRASASRGAAPAGRVDLRHAHVPDAAQAVTGQDPAGLAPRTGQPLFTLI
jgi:hypothetical protein